MRGEERREGREEIPQSRKSTRKSSTVCRRLERARVPRCVLRFVVMNSAVGAGVWWGGGGALRMPQPPQSFPFLSP